MATVTSGDPGEHLVHGRSFSKTAKLASQVLLQRLPEPLGPGLQPGVNTRGHIANQHVWHAYIVQAPTRRCKPQARPPGSRNGSCRYAETPDSRV